MNIHKQQLFWWEQWTENPEGSFGKILQFYEPENYQYWNIYTQTSRSSLEPTFVFSDVFLLVENCWFSIADALHALAAFATFRCRFQRGEMFDKISGSPQYMAPAARFSSTGDMWWLGEPLKSGLILAVNRCQCLGFEKDLPRWAKIDICQHDLKAEYTLEENQWFSWRMLSLASRAHNFTL